METTVLETEEEDEIDEVRIPMTKAQFLAWSDDDGFLYEYENGFAVQTTGIKKKSGLSSVTFRKHSGRRLHLPKMPTCTKKTTFGLRKRRNVFRIWRFLPMLKSKIP